MEKLSYIYRYTSNMVRNEQRFELFQRKALYKYLLLLLLNMFMNIYVFIETANCYDNVHGNI